MYGYTYAARGGIRHIRTVDSKGFTDICTPPSMDLIISFALSAVMTLICEALVNLPEEAKYVWRRQGTWAKWAYFYLRYFPILLLCSTLAVTTSGITNLTYDMVTCQAIYGFMAFGMNSTIWIVDSLLIARVSTLYNLSRNVAYSLLTMLAIEFVTVIIACSLSIPKAGFSAGCFTTSMPRICIASWLSSVLSQIVLFVLTVMHYRHSYNAELAYGSTHAIIMRDGSWAFGVISLVNVGYTLMLHFSGFGPHGYGNIIFFWILVVFSTTGCHIQLNLYRGTAVIFAEEQSYPLNIDTGIYFAHSHTRISQETRS
ncbi:hypothetical protein QCA50_011824 [Cerrena zonata]|uniref:DUF6533 domain-containing protein n=1 Tax=Cerrena zonata TaxID=2478898 RepID=A0AAW0FZW6_9APHY